MKKQPACGQIARCNVLGRTFKIQPRLLVGPRRVAWRQQLQPKIVIGFSVAGIAAGVARALLKKNRLDALLKKFKVERGLRPNSRTGVIIRRGFLNPVRNHFPFRVILSFPKFASGMKWVAAGFVSEWVQQQMAMKGIARSNEFCDDLEILPGLILRPGSLPCLEGPKPQSSLQLGMASVAGYIALALFQKDGLDFRAIGFEIERRARRWIRYLTRLWRLSQRHHWSTWQDETHRDAENEQFEM